ncbi:hypothetical protein F5B22DRAFT_599426 [Xylaria bambusicola]|uniref:uncharacterized protein n=1 Tax=Xylaria bambusicola TaxID=326684 RepID=UPI00200745C0|nr:uncharacterized protein F5B22DRAFT_599426 [Xylaria bambusicola]KAI0518502.1 hypothetical protein F5B22DRAFT_599426 [Xylaria bambusicola]
MAATHETSLPERNQGWFKEPLTEVNQPIRQLLEGYSKIPASEVVSHVNNIRDRGFAANPYPCIGLYRFTLLTLIDHPLYGTIVRRLKQADASYLDVGCCFGQDLRQLVFDGVPSQHLAGLDVAQPLIELGYDLFLDRDLLHSEFLVADVFQGSTQPAWKRLEERGIDVVHCSAFFHLFPLEQQMTAARQIARLVKKGGVVVGRQIGSCRPGDVAAIQEKTYSYRHDVSTFDDMWRRVGEETQTKWRVEGTLDMVGINPDSPVENEDSRRLLFTVTRLQ